MKILDVSENKIRVANAVARIGRIEANVEAHPSHDRRKDQSVTGFDWPLAQRLPTPETINPPMKHCLKDKFANANKNFRESLSYEMRYYRLYNKRRKLKCIETVAASIGNFREKVTVYDKNCDVACFESKCKMIALKSRP